MPESQDPLAQLRDIHLPEAVGLWPLAPGWWLLIALLIGAIVVGTIYLRRRHQSNAFKRQAINQLHALEAIREQDGLAYVQQLNALLKQTALSVHPRADVAGLSGQQWLQYLDQHGDQQSNFVNGAGQCLADAPYRPQLESQQLVALQQLAEQWIKHQTRKRS